MTAHDGIINLFKPLGLTSAQAVYRVRSITRIRKSGHAGALDPAADGVLVVCQGQATKLVEQIMDLPKVYRATARLDVTSESFDSDSRLEEVAVSRIPTEGEIWTALTRFEGIIEQVPPRVSAVKLGGVPAYKTVGRPDAPPMRVRNVHVYWLHLRRYDWPAVEFEMACGRGTYVRALIRDLGLRLGTGGCLTSLTRSAVGPFRAEDSWTLERMQQVGEKTAPFGLPPWSPSGSRLGLTGDYLIPLDRARELVSKRPVEIPPRPE